MALRPTVHVTHGSNSESLALAGESVQAAIGLITGELGWSVGNLDWTLNGERSGDLPDGGRTVLEDDDELSFLARAGNKG
jgi:hypothetical protein